MSRRYLLLIPIAAILFWIVTIKGQHETNPAPLEPPLENPGRDEIEEGPLEAQGVTREVAAQPENMGPLELNGLLDSSLLPVLAQGSALDGFGQAIVGATVVLERSKAVVDAEEWETLDFIEVTDKDGAFVIRGNPVAGTYRIASAHDDFLPGKHPLNLGARGLNLQMRRPWTVRGQLLLNDNIRGKRLLVQALPLSQEIDAQESWTNRKDKFKMDDIPDGVTKFVVSQSDKSFPLFATQLTLGPEGGELDLQDFDLRGLVREITLDVLDSTGSNPPGSWATTLDGAYVGDAFFSPISFLLTEDSIDLEIGGQGCRNIVVKNIRGDMEISLPPGIPLQVEIQNAPSLPKDILWYCEIAPVINGVALELSDSNQLFFHNNVSDLAGVPFPGPFQMRLYLADLRSLDSDVSFKMPKPISVHSDMPLWEVLDQEHVQVFLYSLTQAELEHVEELIQAMMD